MIKEILANVYFLSEEENGRTSDITDTKTAYRPMLCYESNYFHCQIVFGENKSIILGHSYKLKIRIIDICTIKLGAKFELKESKVIGIGEVIELY